MRTVSKRRFQGAVLGGLISLCFVGLLLKRVSLDDAWRTLRILDARRLMLPLLMLALNYPLRALRWQLLFPAQVRPEYWPTFRTYAIGTGANNFAPARAGDVARCVLISRDSSLAGSSLALATFAIEKVLDGVTLLAIVLVACVYMKPPAWLSTLAIAAMVVFGGALACILVFRSKTDWLLARMRAVLSALRLGFLAKKATALFLSFYEGLNGIASTAQMMTLIALTALIWITDAGCVWGMAKAVDLSIALPYAMIVTAVIGLGLAIPAAPASIGTYEFFAVSALGLAGIASGSALACALLLHSWAFVTSSLVGLGCLAWVGLTPKQLVREEEAWEAQEATITDGGQ